jgi:hypothetical protein
MVASRLFAKMRGGGVVGSVVLPRGEVADLGESFFKRLC